MDQKTARVLCMDGGGCRGYLSLKFLQRFLTQWGIQDNELWKYFDVIAGTSIGSILAGGAAYGVPLSNIESFFLTKSKRIFTIRSLTEKFTASHNASLDSNRPDTPQKLALLGTNEPFYESPYGDSNFGHNVLQNTLVETFGADTTLANLKTNVLVPAVERDTNRYVVFSNYSDPMLIGQNEKVVNVLRASSAAPVYLPEHRFNGHSYFDGGVYQNNASMMAVNLALTIKPLAKRICVLSIGTGLGKKGFDVPDTSNPEGNAISKIFALFGWSSAGGQESIDFVLKMLARRTLANLYYYRFQPIFDPNFNNELDNSTPKFFNDLKNIADKEYANDSENITNFLAHLSA